MAQNKASTSRNFYADLYRKLFFLIGLDRRTKLQAAALILMMFVGAGLEAMAIGLIMPFIALLNNPDIVVEYKMSRWAYDALNMASPQEFVMWSAAALLILFVIKNAYLGMTVYFQLRFVCKRQLLLARRLFQAYMESPYIFHLGHNTAELTGNVIHEVVAVFHNVTSQSLMLISEIMVIAVLTAVLLFVNPATTLAAVGVMGGLAYLFFRGVRSQTGKRGKLYQYHHDQIYKWVNQAFGSIKETKLLGCEDFFVNAFTDHFSGYSFSQRYLDMVSLMPRLFIETLTVVGMLIIAIVMLLQGQVVKSLLPTLALFAVAAYRLMPSFHRIVGMVTMIRYFMPAVNVVYRDLELLENVGSSADAPSKDHRTCAKIPFEQSIELKSVAYRYPETNSPAIDGVSLIIPKGRSVAFVGATGAGKTTLVDLIVGLLKPTQGAVLVDGKNIHDDLAGWQRNIGYIPQTIYLCDDTIRRNVAFGLPDDRINDDQVWSALEAAQLKAFVHDLPDKLDTYVGERGARLSGGERQRIGIARCLYYNPEILVLDEATSSLDTATEQEVARAIETLMENKTLIVIAHRLSTIKNCDAICELCDGKLIRTDYEKLTKQGFWGSEKNRKIAT